MRVFKDIPMIWATEEEIKWAKKHGKKVFCVDEQLKLTFYILEKEGKIYCVSEEYVKK